jgi:hypothetical protein
VARSRFEDKLQDHRFWAFDASSAQEVPVFSPLFGFSSITSPTLEVETEEIKDGTFQFPRFLVKGATTSSVTFERASSPFDSDFYDWITHTIYGSKVSQSGGSLSRAITNALGNKHGLETWRRKLVILQFTSIGLIPAGGGVGSVLAGLALTAGIFGLGAAIGPEALLGVTAGIGGIGPFEFSPKLPARGWILHDCVPVNYRAASDFDARSGQISLMELEVQPEYIEEWSLGVKP